MHAESPRLARKTTIFSEHEVFEDVVMVEWHIVKRGLDWTGKTRTGLRLVKRGLDSISKTRTGLY